MTVRIVYRRRRDLCRVCTEPIERAPRMGSDDFGWSHKSGVCYGCWRAVLFGAIMEPSPAWWRKVFKHILAAYELSLLNDRSEHDEDITF